MKARFESVQVRLFGVVLAVALPLAAAMSALWWNSLQEGRALQLALLKSTIAHLERELLDLNGQSEWVLSRMAARPAFRDLRPNACEDEMGLLYEVNLAFLAITLWSKEGDLICSSYPPAPGGPRPKPHRESFDAGLASNGLYLSNMFQGRITGLHLVTFTYPVRNAAGAVTGLLSLPVNMPYFERLLLETAGSTGRAAGIVDRTERLVARVPDNRLWQGKPVSELPGVKKAVQVGEGEFRTTGVDGIRRIVAHKALTGIGWRIYVGAEEEQLYAGYHRQLMQGAVVFALVVAFSLGIAYLIGRGISRPLEALANTADAVAAGHHDRRVRISGGGEIARVAQHLNEMIDELTRTQASLEQSNRRLYELSGRLLRAEADERKRISRELHDEIGQALTALMLDLQMIARRNGPSPDLANRSIGNVERILEQVRDLTRVLRASQLSDKGLSAALEEHARRHVGDHGVHVHCDLRVDDSRLDPDLQAVCFRVAQEALTNIMRHAGARNVWIELQEDEGRLVMKLRDDGAGFDVPSAMRSSSDGRSAGVSNMHDRVELAGGTLEIRSAPGAGTEIVARLPLSQ